MDTAFLESLPAVIFMIYFLVIETRIAELLHFNERRLPRLLFIIIFSLFLPIGRSGTLPMAGWVAGLAVALLLPTSGMTIS
ncbi:hypothetical protein [Desulforhabdus amnigena]|uniref:Uncharacterized protein n=1 Tax=Desulforhabdus amnigena TaxID=40218 RepID=A0A9W6L9E8_9BACT|nr:hypothetical protein [Desulforhabdus amnigena]NLJ27535.1 hypothetical protein [Deltaproteobacteria bacterium]GLI35056.1 hypothetical protein DAMNIGENAA_24890 [Desulforhabdus amnigena]